MAISVPGAPIVTAALEYYVTGNPRECAPDVRRGQFTELPDPDDLQDRLEHILALLYRFGRAAFEPIPEPVLRGLASGFPSNRGDFLIAGSCNFVASADYRTPVHFVSWRSFVCPAWTAGRAAPRVGQAGACPYFLPAGP